MLVLIPLDTKRFEMAVFDALGKRLDVPVHTLLGGACRDKVRADFWIGHQTPEHTGRSTEIAIERGSLGSRRNAGSKSRWWNGYEPSGKLAVRTSK